MGEFKKYIQTEGKTFDEIKRMINEMVKHAVQSSVENILNDVSEKNYKPEKIPPKPQNPTSTGGEDLIYRSSAPGYSQIYYPHEHRSEHLSAQDEYMLDKIGQMRELEVCIRGQRIVKRAVELTMVEQGNFMADVEDDFNRRVFCALPYPIYAAMSNSQLRTFFTWRTDVRKGIFSEADKPYVLLYCYELLNKIGVANSVEAFDKLLEVWENTRGFAPYLNAIMPRWLKDFYAFNDVSEKYPDINEVLEKSTESDLERAFERIDAGDFSGLFDFLAENSAYDIKQSSFYSDLTRPMIENACEVVLCKLHEYFSARGIELSELVCGKLKKDYSWTPFKDATVNLDTADGFRPVRIGASERYCIKRGEPALELFDFAPSKGFIGYLLKSVEAELREKTGFKRKIVPKLQMLQNDLKNRTKLMEATSEQEFLRLIPETVDKFCTENNIRPTASSRKNNDKDSAEYIIEKVEIDISKLDEIRSKSDEIAQKLLIGDDEDFSDAARIISDEICGEEFAAAVDECKSELSPLEEEDFPIFSGNLIFEDLDPDWQTFANNLIPAYIETLKALLNGNVREFCKERGLLPETVFEEINTEALSAYGDVVIECGELVPDYVDVMAQIVRAAGM